MKIAIIQGPNLNLLGTRETHIYGVLTLEEIHCKITEHFPNISFQFYQSNIEGELINYLQQSSKEADGIILNPASYTHTSVAIADAIATINIPVVEVHLSNIHAREEFREKSLTARYTKGIISGFGYYSYILAVHAIQHLLSK